jgi:hypothetical protein
MRIKIPIGLASHYANHRAMIRILATFCRLKAYESSSSIAKWRSNMDELASFCHFSTRTLEGRISEMKTLGLAKVEDGNLSLISWEELWRITNIQVKHKRYWYYDNDKIDCRLEYFFQLLALKEKQKDMRNAYFTRVTNIPGYTTELKYILGVDQKQPITMQDHLVGVLKSFSLQCFSPEENYMLNAVNPDAQISCRKMQEIFGYAESSLSGPSYRKKILAKLGLITIEKRTINSDSRARECISGTVNYSRKTLNTFLRLCDAISPAL